MKSTSDSELQYLCLNKKLAASNKLDKLILEQEEPYPPPQYTVNQIYCSQYATAVRTIREEGLISLNEVKLNTKRQVQKVKLQASSKRRFKLHPQNLSIIKYPLPLAFAYLQAYISDKKPDSAIQVLSDRLQRNNITNPHVINYNLSYLYRQKRDFKKAMFYLQLALKEKPFLLQGVIDYVYLLAKEGRVCEAVDMLKRHLSSSANNVAAFTLAQSPNMQSAFLHLAYKSRATTSERQTTKLFNNKSLTVQTCFNLGLYFKKLYSYEKAQTLFEQIIQKLDEGFERVLESDPQKSFLQKDQKIYFYSKINLYEVYKQMIIKRSHEIHNQLLKGFQIKKLRLKMFDLLKSLTQNQKQANKKFPLFYSKYCEFLKQQASKWEKNLITEEGQQNLEEKEIDPMKTLKFFSADKKLQNLTELKKIKSKPILNITKRHFPIAKKQLQTSITAASSQRDETGIIKEFNKKFQEKRLQNEKKLKFLLLKDKQLDNFFNTLPKINFDQTKANESSQKTLIWPDRSLLSFNESRTNPKQLNQSYPEINSIKPTYVSPHQNKTLIKKLRNELTQNNDLEKLQEEFEKKKLKYQQQFSGYDIDQAVENIMQNLFDLNKSSKITVQQQKGINQNSIIVTKKQSVKEKNQPEAKEKFDLKIKEITSNNLEKETQNQKIKKPIEKTSKKQIEKQVSKQIKKQVVNLLQEQDVKNEVIKEVNFSIGKQVQNKEIENKKVKKQQVKQQVEIKEAKKQQVQKQVKKREVKIEAQKNVEKQIVKEVKRQIKIQVGEQEVQKQDQKQIMRKDVEKQFENQVLKQIVKQQEKRQIEQKESEKEIEKQKFVKQDKSQLIEKQVEKQEAEKTIDKYQIEKQAEKQEVAKEVEKQQVVKQAEKKAEEQAEEQQVVKEVEKVFDKQIEKQQAEKKADQQKQILTQEQKLPSKKSSRQGTLKNFSKKNVFEQGQSIKSSQKLLIESISNASSKNFRISKPPSIEFDKPIKRKQGPKKQSIVLALQFKDQQDKSETQLDTPHIKVSQVEDNNESPSIKAPQNEQSPKDQAAEKERLLSALFSPFNMFKKPSIMENNSLAESEQQSLKRSSLFAEKQGANEIKNIFESFNPVSNRNILINQNAPTSRDQSKRVSKVEKSPVSLNFMAFFDDMMPADTGLPAQFQQKYDKAAQLQTQGYYAQAYQIYIQLYKKFKDDKLKQMILLGIAFNFQLRQQFEQAQKTYLKCSKYNNAQAFMKLGQLLIRQNRIYDGIENLEKANCIQRFDKEIETKLVYAYSLKKETTDKALGLAQAILKRQPESLEILVMTAKILQNQQRIPQALEVCLAIDSHKQSQFIKHYIGTLYLSSGNVVQAFKYFKDALSLNSAHVPSLIEIGTILSQMKPQQAIAILNRALQIQPKNRLALTRLAKIYQSVEENPEKAMEIYRKTLETKLNYQAYMKIGDCQAVNGEYLEALANYHQALNLKQTHTVFRKIAQMYDFKNDYKKAIENYQYALQIIPDDIKYIQQKKQIMMKLAKDLLTIQDYENAIISLEKLLETQQSKQIYEMLGQGYFGKQQYSIALEFYQKADDLNPDQEDSDLLEKMALCFDKKEEFTASKKIYQKIMSISPNNVTIMNNYANILLILGETNEAFYWYQVMLQNAPKNVDKRLKVADIYATIGDWSKVEYHLLICYKMDEHDIRVLQKMVNLYKEKRQQKMVAKYEKKLTLLKAHLKKKQT